jgi:hypothetical protein
MIHSFETGYFVIKNQNFKKLIFAEMSHQFLRNWKTHKQM